MSSAAGIDNITVRVLDEPGEPWVIEYDRSGEALYVNASVLTSGDDDTDTVKAQIETAGAAAITLLTTHPAASDEELTVVALAAVRG